MTIKWVKEDPLVMNRVVVRSGDRVDPSWRL